MMTYANLEHYILGIIWRPFWGIYIRSWISEGVDITQRLTKLAHDIIVSFSIFSLLKYDRIFGKNLEHDTYGVK